MCSSDIKKVTCKNCIEIIKSEKQKKTANITTFTGKEFFDAAMEIARERGAISYKEQNKKAFRLMKKAMQGDADIKECFRVKILANKGIGK